MTTHTALSRGGIVMSGVRAFRWVFVLGMVVAALGAAPVCAAPGPIFALAVDPMTPVTVYAGTSSGVLKSTDGGANWSAVGLPNVLIYSLAIDSVTPTTLYTGSVAPEGLRVFQSTDGGQTWSPTGLTSAVWGVNSV